MNQNHILPFVWMRGEAPKVLREEMKKIHEAGIGAVCLEARPHPDYAGEGWWKDVDIIIEEAKKYDMQIWILDDAHFPTGMANNGMAAHPDKCRRWLYTNFIDVTGPLPMAEVDVETLLTRQFTWMDFGKPQIVPLVNETRLASVTASRMYEGDTVQGEVLDLTDQVKDGVLVTDIPAGTWRIHVNFITTGIGPKPEYINYIEADSVRVLIDEVYEKHYSRYKDLFGTTIAGFFSDEPGFYNTDSFDGLCKLGVRMTLPWGKELEETLSSQYGPAFYKDLTYLYSDEKNGLDKRIRHLYMDTVSRLYGKNFTAQLGDWCRAHGVEYIGHVVEDRLGYMRLGAGIGHFFRAIKGQDMAGIDNIGYQIMPGNDIATRHTGFSDITPEFYHYQLAKLGSSAAAIDPSKKGRTMCENFGAYGWRLGVRDMKWLADYLIGQGINYFVPHAFSMAEYPDSDCPPHFHARGTNPQFPFFCELMKYTNRLCEMFSGGTPVFQAALLFEAEADWVGETMPGSAVCKVLKQHQIDFAILPSDVFVPEEGYNCHVDKDLICLNGLQMKVLIVPECDYLPANAARFIAANPSVRVVYVNRYPKGITGEASEPASLLASAVKDRPIVSLSELGKELLIAEIRDTVYADAPICHLQQYHYVKDGRDYWLLMNTSLSETVDTVLNAPSDHTYGFYDAMTEKTVRAGRKPHLVLPPYASTVLMTEPENAVFAEELTPAGSVQLERFELTLKEMCVDKTRTLKDFAPVPVSSIDKDFSGIMTYKTTFTLDSVPTKALFNAQYVFECMSVSINGTCIGSRIIPPYALDITSAVKEGENELTVTVASTPLRNANTKPCIFGKERTIIEPTGMFGQICIDIFNA